MGNPPSKSAEDKVRIVLAVLRGEISIAAAARRECTSGVSISKWRDLFLAGGQQALDVSSSVSPVPVRQVRRRELRQRRRSPGTIAGRHPGSW